MLDYKEAARRNALTSELHNRMVAENDVVNLTANDLSALSDHFPDLRSLPKKERTPILKQKMDDLKTNLRNFLNTLKAGKFEFTVNGNILEAKLYDKGIREVLEKISQEKAAMLYKSREIFEKAQYLYSTPDKKGNPDIYRWNYFYVPINIAGAGTFGVRIAVRDMQTTYQNDPHSQIYNWNIKKEASLAGAGPGNPTSSGRSSEASKEASLAGEDPGLVPLFFGRSSETSFNKYLPQNNDFVNTADANSIINKYYSMQKTGKL